MAIPAPAPAVARSRSIRRRTAARRGRPEARSPPASADWIGSPRSRRAVGLRRINSQLRPLASSRRRSLFERTRRRRKRRRSRGVTGRGRG